MATEKVAYELTLRDVMTKGLGDIEKKLSALENKLANVERAGSKAANNMSGAFQALGGYISASAIKGFASDVLFTTARFQSLSNSIKFASDTAVQGESSMIWISEMSKHYGLPLRETAEGFKTLQGALMNTKFSSGEVRKMFQQVSTGAVAMGLSADDTKGIFLALGQIMGKGKVQAEELRGQIGERVPGAFSIAARAIGVTTAELDKMMKDGKLLSEEFLPKFAAEMEKTFGKGAEDSVNNLQGSIERLKNSWTEMLTAIGNSDEDGLMGKSLKILSKGVDNFAEEFKTTKQKSRESANPRIINYLDEFEKKYGSERDALYKKGVDKNKVADRLEESAKPEIENLKRLSDEFNTKLDKARKVALIRLGLDDGATPKETDKIIKRGYGGNVNTIANEKDFRMFNDLEKLHETVEFYEQTLKGARQQLDKLKDGKYIPSSSSDLDKESNSVSGHTPRVTNIHIDALIKSTVSGGIQNIIQNASNAQGALKSFMSQLEQALLTVVNDVNIIDE